MGGDHSTGGPRECRSDPCLAVQVSPDQRGVSQQHERGGDVVRIGQDGWEEVADYALSWATSHATVAV